jgi:hypothetical protein
MSKNCSDCEATITDLTAEKHGGRCIPCSRSHPERERRRREQEEFLAKWGPPGDGPIWYDIDRLLELEPRIFIEEILNFLPETWNPAAAIMTKEEVIIRDIACFALKSFQGFFGFVYGRQFQFLEQIRAAAEQIQSIELKRGLDEVFSALDSVGGLEKYWDLPESRTREFERRVQEIDAKYFNEGERGLQYIHD